MNKLKFWFYYLFWVMFQVFGLYFLEMMEIEPGDLVGKPRLGGPAGGISYISFESVRLIAILIYTGIGVRILLKYGINNKTWWKKVGFWYIVYVAIASIGMYLTMGAWFREGYGLYLIDVLYLPILWLLELEICQHIIVKTLRKDREKRVKQSE